MRLARGGSINNLYPESLFCEIATFFLHIVISSKRLKERTMLKCKTILIRSLKGKAMRNCHWEILLGQLNIINSLMNATVFSLLVGIIS